MRIELEKPYSGDYARGYVVKCGDGRKRLVLECFDGKLKSTQYARYLMAVKLGRYLGEDETVDHIDNDKSNDDPSNLQVLSLLDNIKKRAEYEKSRRKHGTYSKYKIDRCRCDLCVEAARKVRNRHLEKHRDEINERRRKAKAKAKMSGGSK